ncbi:MAG: rod-binding protein [Bdellovibrionota bacterium]
MSINRIGAAGGVSRERASAGHEQIAKSDARELEPQRNGKVDEVAKLYEKQFLREMFKAMRSTVTPTNEPSMAENIYRSQLDEQYVDAWGEKGGIGLSNMIYDQIMERYFGQGAAQGLKKQGPVALTDRDVVSVARVNHQSSSTGASAGPNGQVPLQIEVKPSETGAPAKIQAPWDATVLQATKLEGGKQAVTLQHGEGLRSTLVFDGVTSAETKVGEKIAKGQTLGVLSPESKSFLWNLNQPGGRQPTGGAE